MNSTFDLVSYEGMVQQLGPGQALFGVLGEHTLQEVLEHGAHVLGPLDGVLDDKADQLEDTVGVERRCPREQLVQDTAQRPDNTKSINTLNAG